MRGAETRRPVYRFGNFELDTQSGELRKNGTRTRLQDQPLQILLLLLEHAGELVTREQIQNKLWPPDTYVDYDNAINSAMRKLREALGDDSGDPRFIETFARRGYRFIGTIDSSPAQPDTSPPIPDPPPATAVPQKASGSSLTASSSPGEFRIRSRAWLKWAAVAVLLVTAGAVYWFAVRPGKPSAPPEFTLRRLTNGPGLASAADISPDGKLVAYDSTRETPESLEDMDIWVQQVDAGGVIQVTHSGDSWDPSFSRGVGEGCHTGARLGKAICRAGKDGGDGDGLPAAIRPWHPGLGFARSLS